MRIYYVGQLWEGGTCRARMQTLQSFGHHIIPFDITPWTREGNRIFRSLAHKVNYGPNVWRLNQALINHSRSVGSVDLVWVDKGRWISPETLQAIQQQTHGQALHYTPDAHFFDNQSRYFLRSLPYYRWVVTTKPFERELYRKHSGKEPIFVLQGFDPRFAQDQAPVAPHPEVWASDVCFIGHFQPHYANCLKGVSEVTNKLKIWGPNWSRYAHRKEWARRLVRGNGAWGDDYLHALTNSKIALGLLGKHIPETTTTRTFEIPAMGTFMLAERTADHLALFEEGKEAEFFDSTHEMQDKIRFYLANDSARKKIAAAGRERCMRSGYSSAAQLQSIFDHITSNKGRE